MSQPQLGAFFTRQQKVSQQFSAPGPGVGTAHLGALHTAIPRLDSNAAACLRTGKCKVGANACLQQSDLWVVPSIPYTLGGYVTGTTITALPAQPYAN